MRGGAVDVPLFPNYVSSALKVSDHHYAESRLPSAQLLLWGDLWNDMTGQTPTP